MIKKYYRCVRTVLFYLDPECAHRLTIRLLQLAEKFHFLKSAKNTEKPYSILNLNFPNRVGMAAGFDKNGECVDALFALGFGFVEVGTVTPLPQPGNPKPRLFRIPEAKAVINAMGFNNEGIDALVERLKKRKRAGILGVNIGKNKDTPLEKAHEDYDICFRKAYAHAVYVVINISSPNTAGLRDLQSEQYLQTLLSTLKNTQKELSDQQKRYVPLLVKIAPDLSDEELKNLVVTAQSQGVDGIVATNTTLDKTAVENFANGKVAGGLSGKPLTKKSTEVIRKIRKYAGNDWPIIGVGGIFSAQDAEEKFSAGANLIQLYTGFIYEGPALINKLQE